AMALQLRLSQSNCQNITKRLRRSQKKVEQLQEQLQENSDCFDNSDDDSDADEIEFDEESQTATNDFVQKLIQKGKLGSTIFINTTEYLSLVVAQPYSTCNNCKIDKWKYKIKTSELSVKVNTICKQCHTVTIFTNESTEINFLRVVAGAGLLGGINREEWRNIGKRQYFEYQDIMLKDIVQAVHQSADEALTAALNFIKKQPEKKEGYILEGSFDCAWSHVHEASQASGELIFNGFLEGSVHRNYDSSSQQMKHAILIAIIDKITPIIETNDVILDIGIDRDLNSNKTLATQKIVYKIFTDLKHKAKLIRNKLASNSRWKSLEQPIMSFYNKCVYEGVIAHLSDIHDQCWPEVCWFHNSPDMVLAELNLKKYTKNQKKDLLGFLKSFELVRKVAHLALFSEQDYLNLLQLCKDREDK
ncbi:15740_t:CDS:2, partial [Funneliformis geosporum]